jgi:predicted transcriptional regulator
VRRTEARTLHREGLTMDQIAQLFGVTRQRVSALLRED